MASGCCRIDFLPLILLRLLPLLLLDAGTHSLPHEAKMPHVLGGALPTSFEALGSSHEPPPPPRLVAAHRPHDSPLRPRIISHQEEERLLLDGDHADDGDDESVGSSNPLLLGRRQRNYLERFRGGGGSGMYTAARGLVEGEGCGSSERFTVVSSVVPSSEGCYAAVEDTSFGEGSLYSLEDSDENRAVYPKLLTSSSNSDYYWAVALLGTFSDDRILIGCIAQEPTSGAPHPVDATWLCDVDSTGGLTPVDDSQFSVTCSCDGVTPAPTLPGLEEDQETPAATIVPTLLSGDLGTPAPTASLTASPTALADAGLRCSNGVPGVQLGDACCVAACGQCGGSGCSSAGGDDLGAADCCATEIVETGPACDEVGVAPCVVGEVSPTSTAVPTAQPEVTVSAAPTISRDGGVDSSSSSPTGGGWGRTAAPSAAPDVEEGVLSSAGRSAARTSSLAVVLCAGVGALWARLMFVSRCLQQE